MGNGLSRRSLLQLSAQSVAGAGLLSAIPGSGVFSRLDCLTGGPAWAAGGGNAEALVCIYLFGGADTSDLIRSRRFHPALSDLQALYDREAVTVVDHVSEPFRRSRLRPTPGETTADRYAPLRFLPNGFATLEWAAELAGIEPGSGKGAFTFTSGVSVVAPGSAAIEGPQFEHPAIRAAMDATGVAADQLPSTALGRQLADAARLIAARGSLGMRRQVLFAGTSGVTPAGGHNHLREARYRELAQAMAAFHAALIRLGMDGRVITYTDTDVTPGSRGGRLVMGETVAPAGTISHDVYLRAMATGVGLNPARVGTRV